MAGADGRFEPDSVMVRVGEGIGLGEAGEREAARALFAELWEEIGGDAGDAFHRCAIAHSMADVRDDASEELAWDLAALDAADSLTDERLAEGGATVTVAAFYPSLHLNLGECYRKLGDLDHARDHLKRGRASLGALADDGYSAMIRDGFDRLAQALEEADAITHTHTDRLCLRRPIPADAEAVAQIQGDPATNAFNPSGPAGAGKAATMLAAWIADWDRDGIGYWMVAPACGEPVIGVAGVRRDEDVDADHVTYNLYYRFRPAAWGNGFAREAGAAAIEAAAARDPSAVVVAVIHEDNQPSARVATALGLVPDGVTMHDGGERLRFARRLSKHEA
jgi:RimJ/RimL family protein N-acetyltransferase